MQEVMALECTTCGDTKPRNAFSQNQRNRSDRKCIQCISQSDVGLCSACGYTLPWDSFPKDARRRTDIRCSACVLPPHRPSVGLASFALGSFTRTCTYCGAKLFAHETSQFCCANGKHVADFASYFRPPDKPLKDLYNSSWPLLGEDKLPIYDTKLGVTLQTGFSRLSRRFNALFALAQHEVQCSGGEKEVRLHTPFKPANVRIHGTMYRRIFTAGDSVPLRYLIYDPQERDNVAQTHGLAPKLVKQLEALLVPRNDHMRTIRRLARMPDPSQEAALVLSWSEGVDEVAGIIDFDPATNRDCRSVRFTKKRKEAAEYLHPLSPLYEPLSYPLYFPFRGPRLGY